jgi:hypothetical protein
MRSPLTTHRGVVNTMNCRHDPLQDWGQQHKQESNCDTYVHLQQSQSFSLYETHHTADHQGQLVYPPLISLRCFFDTASFHIPDLKEVF